MTDRLSETLPFGTKILLNGKYRTSLRDYTENRRDLYPVWVFHFPEKEVSICRKSTNVTGMTCAACQARVQKSVSNLTGVQECNVNLLKNSMVVTYDDSPAVSHHLKQLKSASLIVSRRDGKEVYYRAADTEPAQNFHHMIEWLVKIACPSQVETQKGTP